MKLRIMAPAVWHGTKIADEEASAAFKLTFRSGGVAGSRPMAIGPTMEVLSEDGRILSILYIKVDGKGKITPSVVNIHSQEEIIPEADKEPRKGSKGGLPIPEKP